MSNFTIVATLLLEGVKAWNHHKSTELEDELMELWRTHDKELDKPSYEEKNDYPNHKLKDFRDNNVVDRCYRELLKLGETYLAAKNAGTDVRDISKE